MKKRKYIKGDEFDFSHLLSNQRLNIYVALEDLDFFWLPKELKKLIYWWYEGKSIFYLAKALKRDIDEVAIILIDLSERKSNLICERNRGLLDSLPVPKSKNFKKSIYTFMKGNPSGYTAFQNFWTVDFIWDERKIITFEQLWIKGLSLEEISKQIKRNKIDSILLLVDRLRKGYISGREGILDGWKNRKAG